MLESKNAAVHLSSNVRCPYNIVAYRFNERFREVTSWNGSACLSAKKEMKVWLIQRVIVSRVVFRLSLTKSSHTHSFILSCFSLCMLWAHADGMDLLVAFMSQSFWIYIVACGKVSAVEFMCFCICWKKNWKTFIEIVRDIETRASSRSSCPPM